MIVLLVAALAITVLVSLLRELGAAERGAEGDWDAGALVRERARRAGCRERPGAWGVRRWRRRPYTEYSRRSAICR